ncbi:hypothetical protein OAE93_01805, partial [bacterium]|nr:hypothetical protein [bacterium]
IQRNTLIEMKHLFTFLLVAISTTTFAQGNLQFDQVKNIVYTGTTPASGALTIGTILVPVGKVWKIEAVSYYILNGSNFTYYPNIGISNYAVVGEQYVWGWSNAGATPIQSVFWLEEGPHNVFCQYAGGSSGNVAPVKVAVSAIEFNVVP